MEDSTKKEFIEAVLAGNTTKLKKLYDTYNSQKWMLKYIGKNGKGHIPIEAWIEQRG